MSFYDDASLVFLAGGAAGKDGKAYNLKPVEELGSNLLSNGTFDDGSDWSFTNANGTHGWSISGGTAICDDSAATANRNLVSTLSLTSGKSYRLRLDILQSEDNMQVVVGGTTLSTTLPTGTNIGYNYDIPASAHSGGILQIYAGTSDLQEVDNISVKEIVAAPADFTFTRGTNLTATRVGKDGYIEKGNEQLARNTAWSDVGLNTAPTGWTDYRLNGGTYDATNVSGQIQFVTTSTQRAFLISQNFNTISNYVLSVTVDEVNTACSVQEVLGLSSNATEVTYFKDGAVISPTTSVEAGSRYSVFVHKYNTSSTTFRIGIGANSGTEGDITVSKPQISYGLAPVDYVENTSTSSSKSFGLLEDEPRFDYTGGGCPALLMEPTRTNYFTYSEYASGNNLVGSPVIEENYAISPEGVLNAFRIEDPSGGTYRRIEKAQSKTTDQVDWTFSVFVKKATSPVSSYGGIALAFSGGTANQAYVGFDEYEGTISQLSGAVSPTNANRLTLHTPVSYGDYWRFAISVSDTDQTSPTPLTNNNTSVSANLYANLSDDGNSISNSEYKDFVAYGMQLEEGLFPTSYIPTYGSSATRAKEYNECSFSGIGSQGTVFGEVEVKDDGAYGTPVALSDGDSTTNFILVYKTNDNKLSYRIRTGGADQGSSINTAALAEGSHKFAFRFKENDCDFFVGGVLVGSNTTVTIPTGLDSIRQYIGTDTNKFHGDTKQLLYFPTVLSNNDSEILTGATSYSSFAAMATSTALNYTLYE